MFVSSMIFHDNYKLTERLGKDPGTAPQVAMAILVGVASWQLAPVCLHCLGSKVAVQREALLLTMCQYFDGVMSSVPCRSLKLQCRRMG